MFLVLALQTATAEYTDRVLVIVNEDVITQSEFEKRSAQVLAERQQPESAMPADFKSKLVEGMIADRLQMQEAERRSLSPSDEEIDLGMARFITQQNISEAQLVQNLALEGRSLADFRATLYQTIALSRLREYYTRARVIVPDYEITGWLAVNGASMNDTQYQVAQLRLEDPQQNRALAESIREAIVANGDFPGIDFGH